MSKVGSKTSVAWQKQGERTEAGQDQGKMDGRERYGVEVTKRNYSRAYIDPTRFSPVTRQPPGFHGMSDSILPYLTIPYHSGLNHGLFGLDFHLFIYRLQTILRSTFMGI